MKVIKFRRGGGATVWPWRQIEVRMFRRCFVLTVSRQQALKEPKSKA